MVMKRKFKEFKVQGIKDYEALYVWKSLEIGTELTVQIEKNDVFVRTDNPNKMSDKSVSIRLKRNGENGELLGFVPDDAASEILDFLTTEHADLFVCHVLAKENDNSIESLTVRVDIVKKEQQSVQEAPSSVQNSTEK